MPRQQGFDHAGMALKRIGLYFAAALQRPQGLGHLQYMIRSRRIEMVGKKLVDLSRAKATLRLQHQADGGGRRRVQTIQTVLHHMDGLMGQHIQLKPWLIAKPLGETESVDAHVVSSAFKPRPAAIKPIDRHAKAFKPLNQTIRSHRQRCRTDWSSPDGQTNDGKQQTRAEHARLTRRKPRLCPCQSAAHLPSKATTQAGLTPNTAKAIEIKTNNKHVQQRFERFHKDL